MLEMHVLNGFKQLAQADDGAAEAEAPGPLQRRSAARLDCPEVGLRLVTGGIRTRSESCVIMHGCKVSWCNTVRSKLLMADCHACSTTLIPFCVPQARV
jgi:hypothetical protein